MTVDHDSPAAMDLLREQLARQEWELQQLRDEIAQLTRTDTLTGVMNHRTLQEWLAAELVRAHRTGHPFCYAIVDIDHFGALNRQHGNTVGDEVLKTFAQASVKHLRALDRFGRIHGDTFGIVLPATWLDSGVIAMNRLRVAVDACPWASLVPGTTVGFSAGLTTNAPGDSPEKLTERALKGVQQARDQGYNCTVTVEDALPDMPVIDD